MGEQEGEPDGFFLGMFGSTVKGTAREDSDVDAYLFYSRGENTPTPATNPYLDYDLSQTFDSPASTMFGYPEGRQPPNPEGTEDVEAHDITNLVTQIAENEPLEAGLATNKLKDIAIIFSPKIIGDTNLVESVRRQILEAMRTRTGKPFDQERFQRLWDRGYSPVLSLPRDHNPQFEDAQFDGNTTWKSVQEEYERLFEKPLEIELET